MALCFLPFKNFSAYILLCASQVSDSNFKVLDEVVKGILKEKQPFERLEMKKSDLLEMFKYNMFKVSSTIPSFPFLYYKQIFTSILF